LVSFPDLYAILITLLPLLPSLSPLPLLSTPGYTAVLIVPTGIGASIGGYAGDALPVAHGIASVVDTLITHPNVMNGTTGGREGEREGADCERSGGRDRGVESKGMDETTAMYGSA